MLLPYSLIICFPRSNGDVSCGIFILLAAVVTLTRILAIILFNNERLGKRALTVIDNRWANSIYPHTQFEAIPRGHNAGSSVHMNWWKTWIFSAGCAAAIIAGIVKRKDTDSRWLIACGAGGFGELLLRWFLELYHDRWSFLGLRPGCKDGIPEDPTPYDVFFSESRLTIAVRRVVPGFARFGRLGQDGHELGELGESIRDEGHQRV